MNWKKGQGKKRSWYLLEVTDEEQTPVKVHSIGILIWCRIPPHRIPNTTQDCQHLTAMTDYRNAHGFLQMSDPADIYICAARSVALIPNGAAVNETKERKCFFCGCLIVRPLMYEHSLHYYCCSPSSRNFFLSLFLLLK